MGPLRRTSDDNDLVPGLGQRSRSCFPDAAAGSSDNDGALVHGVSSRSSGSNHVQLCSTYPDYKGLHRLGACRCCCAVLAFPDAFRRPWIRHTHPDDSRVLR